MTDDVHNPKLINRLVFGEDNDTHSDEEQEDTPGTQDEDAGVDEPTSTYRQQAVGKVSQCEEGINNDETNGPSKGVKPKSAYVHLFECAYLRLRYHDMHHIHGVLHPSYAHYRLE
jgi:hypothetical protein